MRIASLGHAALALTFITLGIVGLISGDFTPVWQPVPKGIPAREFLVYLCALVSLFSGLGLLWQRAEAARALLLLLLLWLLVLRGLDIANAPYAQVTWSGAGETTVMVAGVWVLYAWFAGQRDVRHIPFATGISGVRIARILFALALIPFGTAHFVYLKETASLVPAWLPAHNAWAWLTGGAYIAAAAAILTGLGARVAASLAAWQMAGFTLLVWIPVMLAGSHDAFQWSETVLSIALTASAWVVADSYRAHQ